MKKRRASAHFGRATWKVDGCLNRRIIKARSRDGSLTPRHIYYQRQHMTRWYKWMRRSYAGHHLDGDLNNNEVTNLRLMRISENLRFR